MHRVSDQLEDRHPYQDLPFTESYNPLEVHRAFGSRAIDKYGELLVMDDLPDGDRARALSEFHELLSNQEFKSVAIDKEVMFACVELTDSGNLTVRINAAMVISSLVLYQNDQFQELSTEAMLRATVNLLHDREEQVVIAACTIFRNLTRTNEGAGLLASRIEAIQRLTSMLTTVPVKTIDEPRLALILEILANVSRIHEGAQVVSKCMVTVPILAVLNKCVVYEAQTVQSAALILLNLAVHEQGKQLIVKESGVEICLKVLSKVLQCKSTFQNCDKKLHNELTRCLVSAVMALSTVEDAKPRVVEFGVEPLVGCLYHDSKAIKENAIITINSSCESPKGISAFTTKLLSNHDLLIEVLGYKCIPALLKYLQDVDEDTKNHALHVLVVLTQLEEGVREVVQCLNMLDTLMELLVDPVPMVPPQAITILNQIAKCGDLTIRRIGKRLIKYNISQQDFQSILGIDQLTFEDKYC